MDKQNRSYSGKKLIVLGGASQHCKVVEAAHRLGSIVYVVDYLKDSPAKLIADKHYLIDVNSTDKLTELCKEESIDGAISTSLDACQIPYQRLCERMGYPCFGSAEQFKILTDKKSFKKCCEKYGVDTIPSYTTEEIAQSGGKVEYPVFVKPSDSRGSRGQSICYDKTSAIEAIKRAIECSPSKDVLIEKYMEGYPDFTAAYLVKDGIPVLVRTGDRFEGPSGSGLENLCIASSSPSKFTEKFLNGPNKRVVALLKGIGLYNAPAFFQGFIDGDRIRFYDPGLRFAGGEYERLLYAATGIDIIQMLVEFALSGHPSFKTIDNSLCNLNGKRIIQLDPALSSGIIGDIRGIDILKEDPSIIEISQRYRVGDEVPVCNDLRNRFAEIAILSDSLENEIDSVRYVQKNLDVLDTRGKSMIVYPFDARNLG